MRRTICLTIVGAAAAMAAGCGGDDDGGAAEQAEVKPEVRVDVNKDPRAITCRDLSDKEASARMSRTATFTLADELLEEKPKLVNVSNRNQLAQRIFIGMVELCEDGDAALKPAEQAMAGVADGKYQLAPPAEKYVGE
jgi:hypothetical protein